jgi:hypothetical protein
MRDFWTKAKLLSSTQATDVVNEDIWASSVAVHSQPGGENMLLLPGSVGPQQAMLDPTIHPWLSSGTIAPWVPDLLGEEWTHPNAVFVVGSALAGFIQRYSSRDNVMSLDAYLAAHDWKSFQKAFLRDVVISDGDYYEKLCPLINHGSRFAVFDIARYSLVVRGALQGGARRDENINTRLLDHRTVFAQYAEHPKSKQWTKARLTSSRARIIIALGFTAEYALVRLFADMGMRVRDSLTQAIWKQRVLREPDNWTYGYPGGSRDRPLGRRYSPPSWWQIDDPGTGTPRWALVPVVHPSSRGDDPDYHKSRRLIAAVRRQTRCWLVD